MKITVPLVLCLLIAVADAEVRSLPLYSEAWAGSSVNVLANQSSTLITDGGFQYAAFYAADAHLVLAKRALNTDKWETRQTEHTGNVADAHNTVSIAVDGAGYLHVAWDHHANPLNYCRSISPGSLELGPKMVMTGLLEKSVTYPLFFRHPDGGLLFLYRDGRSGKGNVVLNRYDLPGGGRDKSRADSSRQRDDSRIGVWRQLHENLIDGEGARSAYLAATLDAHGTLHLAWNWRDSPDVATNHDLCYAKSSDGGQNWTTTKGANLTLPITASTAEYALRIPQNSTLMNPPSLSTDSEGHPFIVTYWALAETHIPQFHLVRHDGTQWSTSVITHRTQSFELQGTSTKRPPISRAAVLAGTPSRGTPATCVVYRDDERGGRIILSSCETLGAGVWKDIELTTKSVGAWEPSIAATQWGNFGQIHLLVQNVQQLDGNDSKPEAVPPSPISVLIWNPHQR
jgi:BNR repeat-containing family member